MIKQGRRKKREGKEEKVQYGTSTWTGDIGHKGGRSGKGPTDNNHVTAVSRTHNRQSTRLLALNTHTTARVSDHQSFQVLLPEWHACHLQQKSEDPLLPLSAPTLSSHRHPRSTPQHNAQTTRRAAAATEGRRRRNRKYHRTSNHSRQIPTAKPPSLGTLHTPSRTRRHPCSGGSAKTARPHPLHAPSAQTITAS